MRITLEPGGADLGTHLVSPDGTVTARFSTAGFALGAYTVSWTSVG